MRLKRYFSSFIILVALVSCGKTFTETDPSTGIKPGALTTIPGSTCNIVSIKQINGNTEYSQWLYNRDAGNVLNVIDYRDNNNSIASYRLLLTYSSDTVYVDSTSKIIKDHFSGNVIKYIVKEKVLDSLYDNVVYLYEYDNFGRLISKKIFYNQLNKPDYITEYYYVNNNLINCQLFTGDKKQRLLQSKFTYDLSRKISPWLYQFSDAFESYQFLPGFSYGIKPENPIIKIETFIYDVSDNSIKDTWVTNFSGYVFSADFYVLQVTVSGDTQQGLGNLIGTQRFGYQCIP